MCFLHLTRRNIPIAVLQQLPQKCVEDICKFILLKPIKILETLADRGLYEQDENHFKTAFAILHKITTFQHNFSESEKMALERKRLRVKDYERKMKLRMTLKEAGKISIRACTEQNFGEQLRANDMIAKTWTNHWPWAWSELDDKIRWAETRRVEKGFIFFTTSYERGSWEKFCEKLEKEAPTYETKLKLHNNEIYLEEILHRAVHTAMAAHWLDHDEKTFKIAEKMIAMAETMGPQKFWQVQHWEKIGQAKNKIAWVKANRCSPCLYFP